MKPDYKNWMPKGTILSFVAGTAASLLLCLLFACSGWVSGTWQTLLTTLFTVLAVLFCGLTIWSVLMYRSFDYNGKRQKSRQIIEGVAAYIKLPQGGKCLDIKTPTLIQFNICTNVRDEMLKKATVNMGEVFGNREKG